MALGRVSREEFLRPAYRISDAIELLEKAYNRSGGVVPDPAPDYEGVQAWMWVPSLYSAIEQGFKLLIQVGGMKPAYGHRLGDLYRRLSSAHKRDFDDAFAGYIELHDGIPYRAIEPFLGRVDVGARGEDGRDQDGYTTWRYLLLEGFPKNEAKQPRVSIGAMLEIARAIGHILRQLINNQDQGRFQTVIPRLDMALDGEMRQIADRDCQRPEIEEAIHEDGQDFLGHFQTSYSNTHSLIIRNIGVIIEFLSLSIRHGEPFGELTENLKRVCEFMKGSDRENYLRYCSKVREGKLSIPHRKFREG